MSQMAEVICRILWQHRLKGSGITMTAVTSAKVKYGVWGLILGAVIAMIVGFGWGGWTSYGTTQKMTQAAVLESHAAICIAQFVQQPDYEEKLKAFEAYSSWQKAEFVEKGGWDKMPGQDKAGAAVAHACAEGIALLPKI
jgi:hypothetical protein